MKVLVACEFSGRVREAFKEKGHDAWSCDLLPTEIPGQHIQDDVLKHLNDGWDLMIAHPPCTYLANSGVQHLHTKPERWKQLDDARDFFMYFYTSNIPKIAIENPLGSVYLSCQSVYNSLNDWLREITKLCLIILKLKCQSGIDDSGYGIKNWIENYQLKCQMPAYQKGDLLTFSVVRLIKGGWIC
jgi:hypothetical protein